MSQALLLLIESFVVGDTKKIHLPPLLVLDHMYFDNSATVLSHLVALVLLKDVLTSLSILMEHSHSQLVIGRVAIILSSTCICPYLHKLVLFLECLIVNLDLGQLSNVATTFQVQHQKILQMEDHPYRAAR